MNSSMDKITFAVETERILQILSSEIYDSPNALLRENLQNAYDAVLMRSVSEGTDLTEKTIRVEVSNEVLVIEDEGIGMTEEVLRQNFWRAGSSGKLTELAQKSGVIGTFGIGALANFGVCTKLTVETRHIDSEVTLISTAERNKLAIAEDCISLEVLKDGRPPGTKITIYLDSGYTLTKDQAKKYLEPYVRHLPPKVLLNGELISQRSFSDSILEKRQGFKALPEKRASEGNYSALVKVFVNSQGHALVQMQEISLAGQDNQGELFLLQQGGQLYALRNFFGLAPTPISGHYQLGGVANLSFLKPTAGREALSRESISHLNKLVNLAEREVSEAIAGTDAADRNSSFLNYVYGLNRNDLAGNIKISLLPEGNSIPLGKVIDYCAPNLPRYYTGRDQETVNMFASENTPLLHVSQVNPRRNIQIRFLGKLQVKAIPDTATISDYYKESDLSFPEVALLIRISSTLQDDYLFSETKIKFVKISHGVPFLAAMEQNVLEVNIARDWPAVAPMLDCYKTAFEIFPALVKDFVRSHIYQRISQFVPSSARQGTDALHRLLKQNKELYRIEERERGELESLFGDYLSGTVEFAEVIKQATKSKKSQTQKVTSAQVGSIEHEVPGVANSPASPPPQENNNGDPKNYPAMPPILRTEQGTDMKILTTTEPYPMLNGFGSFLGLSDRLFKREGDFFRRSHTTKVMWSNHRVIYIFTAEETNFSMYYDIELKEPICDGSVFGGMLPTTTIVMKNRIFIPIPPQLESTFKVGDIAKEFYVRFDILSS